MIIRAMFEDIILIYYNFKNIYLLFIFLKLLIQNIIFLLFNF